jgi:hypothetical protein
MIVGGRTPGAGRPQAPLANECVASYYLPGMRFAVTETFEG